MIDPDEPFGLQVGTHPGSGEPFCWLPDQDQNLVVLGGPGTGRTTAAVGVAYEAAVDFEQTVRVAEPFACSQMARYVPLMAIARDVRLVQGLVAQAPLLIQGKARGYLVVEDGSMPSKVPGAERVAAFEEALDALSRMDGLHVILVTADRPRAARMASRGAAVLVTGCSVTDPGYLSLARPGAKVADPPASVREAPLLFSSPRLLGATWLRAARAAV